MAGRPRQKAASVKRKLAADAVTADAVTADAVTADPEIYDKSSMCCGAEELLLPSWSAAKKCLTWRRETTPVVRIAADGAAGCTGRTQRVDSLQFRTTPQFRPAEHPAEEEVGRFGSAFCQQTNKGFGVRDKWMIFRLLFTGDGWWRLLADGAVQVEAGRRTGAATFHGGDQSLQLLFAESFEERVRFQLHLAFGMRRLCNLLLTGSIFSRLIFEGPDSSRTPQPLEQGVASRRTKHEHE
jgi:hypothetical protein